jgi:hypothetical protein
MYTTHDDRNVADRTRTYGEGRGCAIEDPQNNRCAGEVAVLDRVQRNFSEGEACLWQHLQKGYRPQLVMAIAIPFFLSL